MLQVLWLTLQLHISRHIWRPSPGSLAQPTTLVPRDRRPIVMVLGTEGVKVGTTAAHGAPRRPPLLVLWPYVWARRLSRPAKASGLGDNPRAVHCILDLDATPIRVLLQGGSRRPLQASQWWSSQWMWCLGTGVRGGRSAHVADRRSLGLLRKTCLGGLSKSCQLHAELLSCPNGVRANCALVFRNVIRISVDISARITANSVGFFPGPTRARTAATCMYIRWYDQNYICEKRTS